MQDVVEVVREVKLVLVVCRVYVVVFHDEGLVCCGALCNQQVM